ncbi:MAG: SDR family oxidoreductase [Nitrospina sp.]|jgi:NAD(P)-dependent dehydrogenase (short-subunit alcohol dehydrogenase family)|nr:SDR family oxidoreductase [Nitrospina sp.]
MTHSLIIGGTRGLGRVVTRQLAARGDVVSVVGRTEVSAEDLQAGKIHSYKADIDDNDSIRSTLDQLVKENGKVNYCVFLQRYRGKGDEWMGELQTTLTATKNIVEYLAPQFSETEDNGFVMVGSVFSQYVGESQAVSYHVAKAGLDQMMRYYALNLGSKNIRVNGISTFTFLKDESKEFYLKNKPLMELYESIVPLKRMGTTEDLANVISFLCSGQASFVTGQSILIDGGLSLHWPESLSRRLKEI